MSWGIYSVPSTIQLYRLDSCIRRRWRSIRSGTHVNPSTRFGGAHYLSYTFTSIRLHLPTAAPSRSINDWNGMSEDDEQICFFDWLDWQQKNDPRLFAIYHPANGGFRAPKTARRLKKMGVKPGVPDICVPIPTGKYPGLYIEMKVKPNKLTDSQILFTSLLHSLGHCVRIAWSAQEAIDILKRYLDGTE